MMVIKFYMTDYNAFALTGRDCTNTGGASIKRNL